MKVVNYNGRKVRLMKGQSLAIVKEYGTGKWAKPRVTLCVIREHYFLNGMPKHTVFDVIQELEVKDKGYSWNGDFRSRNYQLIDRA